MATLKKHGHELFRWVSATKETAYMSSGTVLQNRGFGWKVYGKAKPGTNPEEFAQKTIGPLKNKALREMITKNARKFLEANFDKDVILEKTEKIYQGAIGQYFKRK